MGNFICNLRVCFKVCLPHYEDVGFPSGLTYIRTSLIGENTKTAQSK